MAPNEGLKADLAGAILDGTPIDWASAESVADASERRLIERLRLLATVADFHRDLLLRSSPAPALAEGDGQADQPARWGHLRVLERIGRGAFGEVYRAWDPRLDREVALKLLPIGSSVANRRTASIIEEGRLLARVRHPNVVTIYGAERIENRIGLWMEFIKGRTLEQVVEQDGVFKTAKAVDVGIELCRAVSAVHRAGLLHRDIKAHNVILAEDGRVVLMDFGTGRELGNDSTDLAGTPLYLAPELLDGAAASVSSDIYSVGVLLYHLLTGSYPVPAKGMRDLRVAHERQEHVEITTLEPELPPKLARVIERAIDARPERRYDTVDALASSLAAFKPRPRAVRFAYATACAAVVALGVWIGSELRGHEAAGPQGVSLASATAASGGTSAVRKFDPTARPIIAVLPLKNLSAEPESDYFVDGLTDEMIRNLAVIEGLDVRSRTSSFFFKDKPRNLRDVAKQLGANLVVEGSVLRAGSRLRVNAQLVAVASDIPLWSQRFDRELKDVFAIQDEIARAIVNELRLTLGRGQRRYDTNLEAYELYLKARALVDRRGAPALEAAELFRSVIAKDPAFAPAYAGLTSAYAFLSMFPYAGGASFNTAHSVMRPAAVKALQLDPLLAEAHAAMGMVHASECNWIEADAAFRRALELNPRITPIYTTYAFSTLAPLGRLDEAERMLQAALRSDPLSLDVRREMASVHFKAGRYEEAIADLERVRSVDPEFPFVGANLGRALMFAGRLSEAIPLLESEGGDQYLAPAYVRAGRRAEVEKMAVAQKAYPIRVARIYAALGDKDRAFKALDRAVVTEPYRVALLLQYPEMAALRSDPRLATLRRTLNLPPNATPDRMP